jgi:hypothetical protein
MLRDARQFLVILAFMLWQGGFIFYGAVVVPIGTAVLESDRLQGFITQRVSIWLNILGVTWCIVCAWDSWHHRDRLRMTLVGIVFVLLLGLFATHVEMSTHLDPEEQTLSDRPTFRRWHQLYLCMSTIQWLIALVTLRLTLRSWNPHEKSDLRSG